MISSKVSVNHSMRKSWDGRACRQACTSGLLLIGYFEGIDSERGIAWRAADSLALRDFLGVGLEDAPPDHSTISRTSRLIDLETHRAVFSVIENATCTTRCYHLPM